MRSIALVLAVSALVVWVACSSGTTNPTCDPQIDSRCPGGCEGVAPGYCCGDASPSCVNGRPVCPSGVRGVACDAPTDAGDAGDAGAMDAGDAAADAKGDQ